MIWALTHKTLKAMSRFPRPNLCRWKFTRSWLSFDSIFIFRVFSQSNWWTCNVTHLLIFFFLVSVQTFIFTPKEGRIKKLNQLDKPAKICLWTWFRWWWGENSDPIRIQQGPFGNYLHLLTAGTFWALMKCVIEFFFKLIFSFTLSEGAWLA